MCTVRISYTRGDKTISMGLHDVKDRDDLILTVSEMVARIEEALELEEVKP